jgi:hypothetical protein
LVFVGERRSPRAIKLGVKWEDGRLSGKTLFDALRAAGIEPTAHLYLNLFREEPGRRIDRAALRRVRALARQGLLVVGLGCKVQRALDHAGVAHRPLTHPAARGAVRRRAVYQAHVAAVLGAGTDAPAWPTPGAAA